MAIIIRKTDDGEFWTLHDAEFRERWGLPLIGPLTRECDLAFHSDRIGAEETAREIMAARKP